MEWKTQTIISHLEHDQTEDERETSAHAGGGVRTCLPKGPLWSIGWLCKEWKLQRKHLESTLQQVINNGSFQRSCPNGWFYLRQESEQLSVLQLSELKLCCQLTESGGGGDLKDIFEVSNHFRVTFTNSPTLVFVNFPLNLQKQLCYSFTNLRAALNAALVPHAFTPAAIGGAAPNIVT